MIDAAWQLDIGATVLDSKRVRFRVWAPRATKVKVQVFGGGYTRSLPLTDDQWGYFVGEEEVGEDDRYIFQLDEGRGYPDPASRFQPEGVHGPSQIVNPAAFTWQDNAWKGLPIEQYIIYELHTGTFTPEGTFEAIIPRLESLADLGVTAIELMPVAQFPGTRNWGYDGTYPYGPQNSYGGPTGLKRFVNACHALGLAVVFDVSYNHLGPEGNYLANFGPYFTDRYRTPWGQAVNFDGPHSDEVRHYFISNACYWVAEYHVDALRIDAIQGIFDFSAHHFLEELGRAVHLLAADLGRRVYLIAESDLNDVRVINPPRLGGYGLDAQWNDDFHHALHTLLTDERYGYYEDFGGLDQLATAYLEGFVFSGQYSRHRKRSHGNSSRRRPATQFVVFSQNHDQVGNRDRLSRLLPFDKLKVAAAVVLLSPFVPLLFMGEEYGEQAPFHYFVSHGDPALVEAVRQGRQAECLVCAWPGEIPDPQAEATFRSSVIDWSLRGMSGYHEVLGNYYRELIYLRKTIPAVGRARKEALHVDTLDAEKVLCVRGGSEDDTVVHVYSFNERPTEISLQFPAGEWKKIHDSSETRWMGRGKLAPQELRPGDEPLTLLLDGCGVLLYRKRRGTAVP